MGIRLDSVLGFVGVIIFFYYDFLLVKVIVKVRDYLVVVVKMLRIFKEFRIRGVKVSLYKSIYVIIVSVKSYIFFLIDFFISYSNIKC